MQTVKMVVSGTVNSGKSQFIRTISEIEVVATERHATDETKNRKTNTTVAMDFGRIAIDQNVVLHLFGTPGQRRFDYMWEILAEGALGLVVLVDSTRPETFRETLKIIEFFSSRQALPFVVAANKQDLPNAWSPDELRLAMRLPRDIKIVPCVATDRQQVKNALLELLYSIMALSGE